MSALVVVCSALYGARAAAEQPRSLGLITPGQLVWAGDQEGGGPYVFPSDDDPRRVVGFEVELADTVHVFAEGTRAEYGPVEAVFRQPQHDTTRAFLRKLASW